MYQLSGERYRDGAHEWGVYQDAAEPSVWIEWFFLPSWDEHLRQHERATKHDQDIHARPRQFHLGAEPPEVSHPLAPLRAMQTVSPTQGNAACRHRKSTRLNSRPSSALRMQTSPS